MALAKARQDLKDRETLEQRKEAEAQEMTQTNVQLQVSLQRITRRSPTFVTYRSIKRRQTDASLSCRAAGNCPAPVRGQRSHQQTRRRIERDSVRVYAKGAQRRDRVAILQQERREIGRHQTRDQEVSSSRSRRRSESLMLRHRAFAFQLQGSWYCQRVYEMQARARRARRIGQSFQTKDL